MTKIQIEQQLFVLRKSFEKTPEFNFDGTRNKKYWPLKKKIENLEDKLKNNSWNEYLSK